MNTPSSVANQALDAIGWPDVLGDIEDGSHHAQVVLRAYIQCLTQLLRAANWNFARKTAPLTLLADASGNTALVGTLVPTPWVYEYAYPTDCMKPRFVPWNLSNQASNVPPGNIQIPDTPQLTGIGTQPLLGQRVVPSRFVVATDFNYPTGMIGPASWETQGISPQGRTVILTNTKQAQLIYTALMLYPSVWDALFRAAFVAYLASEIALPIWAKKDRKFGLQMRDEQLPVVKAKVLEARLVDGNEVGLSSNDLAVDWMQTRRTGGSWSGQGMWTASDGPGCYGYGWEPLTLGGAVF